MRGNEKIFKMGLTGLFLSPTFAYASCGEEILPLKLYEDISFYSLIVGFVLIFAAIFLEKKKVKLSLGVAAVLPSFSLGLRQLSGGLR